MASKPKFEKLLSLFEAQSDFSLTESQYEKSTGAALPKDFYYLKSKSALATLAKKYGFSVEIQEKTICLKKKENKR